MILKPEECEQIITSTLYPLVSTLA